MASVTCFNSGSRLELARASRELQLLNGSWSHPHRAFGAVCLLVSLWRNEVWGLLFHRLLMSLEILLTSFFFFDLVKVLQKLYSKVQAVSPA